MQRFRNKIVKYLDFYRAFSGLGCFDVNQVRMVQPDFDRNALTRWLASGYIVQLKNGLYAFKEWTALPGTDLIAANLMYRPSYVSLYSALSHYGMIPEFIAHTTSVTTLKTASFSNEMGNFDYRHIKPDLFWGYHMIDSTNQRKILIALPEKALLDLLYLTPSLKSEDDMLQLRLDEDYMKSDFDLEQAQKFLGRFNSQALSHRFNLLQKVYLND